MKRLFNQLTISIQNRIECFDVFLEEKKQGWQENTEGQSDEGSFVAVFHSQSQSKGCAEKGGAEEKEVQSWKVGQDHTGAIISKVFQVCQWNTEKVVKPVLVWVMAVVTVLLAIHAKVPFPKETS